MVDRCPLATYMGRGALWDYRIVANADGRVSLQQEVDAVVYGVLWLLDRNEILELDYFEGLDHGQATRRLVNVVDRSGSTLRAEVYIPTRISRTKQGAAYLDAIIRAASHRALPEAYLLELEALKVLMDQGSR